MYELFFLANAFFFFFIIAIYVGVYVFENKNKTLGKAAVHRKEGSTLSKIFLRKIVKKKKINFIS